MSKPPAHLINAMGRWREAYNPMRGLTIERCVRYLEEYQQGIMANVQWLFAHIEGQDATLMTVIENLDAAIGEIDWDIAQVSPDSRRYDAVLAAEQEACLRSAYERIENLEEAISHLVLARFRGFSHVAPWCRLEGRLDTLYRLQPINQWNMVRQGLTGPWAYNPAADPISYEQARADYRLGREDVIVRERTRYINRLGLIKYIRSTTAEKDWDAYVEIYGVPACFIVLPTNIPPDKEPAWLELAQQSAEGAGAVLPGGADVKTLSENRAVQPFQARLEWLEKQLVLAATGGMLTVLAESGSGTLAGSVHKQVFDTLAAAEAKRCASVLQAWLDKRLLSAAFPGQPHLAYFTLSRPEEKDVGEVVTQICALRNAGIEVAKEQIEEMTGYTICALRERPAPATPVGAFSALPQTACKALASARQTPRSQRITNLWLALRREGYAPLARRVYALLSAEGEAQRGLAQALLDDLPAISHELLVDNPLGEALATELREAYLTAAQTAATFATPPEATCKAGEVSKKDATVANSRTYVRGGDPKFPGRFSKTPGSGQREGETKSHDRFGNMDETFLEANPRKREERAKAAFDYVMTSHRTVDKAVYREEVGWIRLEWGDAGDPSNAYKGGHGLAHISAKHGKDLKYLPSLLAKGDLYEHEENGKLYVVHGDRFAVLAPLAKGKKKTITEYEPKKPEEIERIKKNPKRKRPGQN